MWEESTNTIPELVPTAVPLKSPQSSFLNAQKEIADVQLIAQATVSAFAYESRR